MKVAILTPAYGRDYASAKAAVADFDNDIDFILNDPRSRWDGKPCNKSDLIAGGEYDRVNIRFKNLRRICVIEKLEPTRIARDPVRIGDGDQKR